LLLWLLLFCVVVVVSVDVDDVVLVVRKLVVIVWKVKQYPVSKTSFISAAFLSTRSKFSYEAIDTSGPIVFIFEYLMAVKNAANSGPQSTLNIGNTYSSRRHLSTNCTTREFCSLLRSQPVLDVAVVASFHGVGTIWIEEENSPWSNPDPHSDS
jgi:hypothetical protein